MLGSEMREIWMQIKYGIDFIIPLQSAYQKVRIPDLGNIF